jgi:hypothetical protein
MAWLGKAGEGAEGINADLDVKISTPYDATETNRLRADVWLIIMGTLVPISAVAMIAGGAAGVWPIKIIGGLLGLVALFCGTISLPHLCRMFISSIIYPESGKRRKSAKILRWVTPKPRDSWIGIVCAILVTGFLYLAGMWEWIISR